KEIEIDPNASVEVVDGMKGCLKEPFTGWVGGPVQPVVQNGALVVANPIAQPNFYDVQYHVASGIPTAVGSKHNVTSRIKDTTNATMVDVLGDWGSQQYTRIPVTQEWEEV